MSEAEDRDQADAPGAGGEEEEEEEAGDPEMEANLNHLEEVQGELDKVRVCSFVRSHTNVSRTYFRKILSHEVTHCAAWGITIFTRTASNTDGKLRFP